MKKTLIFFIILIYIVIFSLWNKNSSIVSIDSPLNLEKTIINNADKSILIVLDIDDTLTYSNKPVLRANALNKLINSICTKLNCNISEAINLIELALLEASEHLGYGDPVSYSLIKTLQDLINQGIR